VTEGGSTIVYRIQADDRIYYLRILPEADVSLAAEVTAHQQLGALGVHVPDVVHFMPRHPVFERSVTLTTAIPGRAIGYTQPPQQVATILHAAGRELAQINQLPVVGFGWANRIAPATGGIAAEFPSVGDWLAAHFAEPLNALTLSNLLPRHSAEHLVQLLDRTNALYAAEPAMLAHGDFDVTHIYYQDGEYSGIIDFGEIRGAPWFYDLSHFAIENAELLPFLLAGYAEVRPVTAAEQEQIALLSQLIAARRIGRRILQQRPPHPPDLAFLASVS
jgi:Ser/Thr protein kinase RdoA (MazF antagonist)